MDRISKPIYGIINSGIFGAQIISGIVVGIEYTEEEPIYTIAFGKNSWRTTIVTEDKEELFKLLNIASLDRVKETHNLKIRYKK